MHLQIETPTGNTRGPVHMESLLKTIHRANTKRCPLTLCFESRNGRVGLSVDCPDSLRSYFTQELQDAYPGSKVSIKKRSPPRIEQIVWSTELRKVPDVLPTRTWESFVDETETRKFADPIAGLLAAIRTGASGRIDCRVELQIRPATPARLRTAKRIFAAIHRRFRSHILRDAYLQLSTHPRYALRYLAWLIGRLATNRVSGNGSEFAVDSVFECQLLVATRAPADAAQIANKKLREIAGAFGRFNGNDITFDADEIRIGRRHRHRGFLMSVREVATIWHPPTESADEVSRIQRPAFREIEPPVELTNRMIGPSDTILGRVCYRDQKNLVPIAMDDLRRHLIVIGKTGCGKSTFLLNIVRQQMEKNRGTVLFDPHGQLAEEVIECVPRRRKNDLVYFNAADPAVPVTFNPLVGPAGTDPTLIADGVLTSFKNVFGLDAASAPRLLHIFRNTLLSLIGTPNASLASVQRMLVDAMFRKSMIANIQNQAVREFWITEFNRWNERDRTQYVASLQNKLGAFTTNERLNRILSPHRKGIVLRELMDKSKILICNLSKGTVGHEASTLLGSLLLSSLQIAAMSRADVAESERPDCVVVIDEFHSYLADGNSTMADALAESRKYRTSYVLSTQMLEGQLDSATVTAVLGNCGSAMCMTIGPRDAEALAQLLGTGLTQFDLMKIPKYHGYLRTLQRGKPDSYSLRTLPPQL